MHGTKTRVGDMKEKAGNESYIEQGEGSNRTCRMAMLFYQFRMMHPRITPTYKFAVICHVLNQPAYPELCSNLLLVTFYRTDLSPINVDILVIDIL